MSADAGDNRQQFEHMYRTTCKPILAYLTRRTSDPQDAADMLAEVYLVAWRRKEVLPPLDEARLWLFGVARKVLANHRRRLDRDSSLAGSLAAELSRRMPALDADTRSEVLRTALKRLDEDDRELLMLAAWEELTPSQIAATTGRSPGAVRVHLHRARARLRLAMQELDDDNEVPGQFQVHSNFA